MIIINWKGFLKPDLRKFLTFLAMPIGYIVLLNVFEQISALVKNESLTLIFSGISGVLLGIAALPALVTSAVFESVGIVPFPDISTGSIIESISSSFIILLTIFWMYFISCMVVFYYNRLRAKK